MIRWSWWQANNGVSTTILTQNHCGSADCYNEQPHSHWLSVPAVIVLGAATTRSNGNEFIWVMVYCQYVNFIPLVMDNWLLYHLPPPRCLELLAAPPPGSPGAAHWGWGLWVESSVIGCLLVLTGLGPGLWVWGTGHHYCLLTKESFGMSDRCIFYFFRLHNMLWL